MRPRRARRCGGGCGVLVQVTVAATTLAGADDRPAELAGYGPITANTARRLAAAAGAAPAARHRLLPIDPATGALLPDPATAALDHATSTYRPAAALTRYLHARDRVCGFPGCNTPAHRCDLDHTTPWPKGPTSPQNMGALCRRHHRLKHETPWRLTRTPDGTPTWTSPAGNTYQVKPPPYD